MKKLDERIHRNIYDFLRENVLSETNWNYHYGQNHDGRPYYSENRYMCGHETGQFGSGTYFSTYQSTNPYESHENMSKYGKDNPNQEPQFIQIDKNLYRVDFDLYENLYRVHNEMQGNLLHSMMTDLNHFFYRVGGYLPDKDSKYHIKNSNFDNSAIYQRIAANSNYLHLKCPSYMKLTRMAQEHARDNTKPQSFATVFMEYNGYNGVNVSGIPMFDRSKHGSVIYDLNKVRSDIHPMENKGVSPFTMTKGWAHVSSLAYDFTNDKESAIADSLVGKLNCYKLPELDATTRLRIVKNVINANGEITGKEAKYYLSDYPEILNYIFNAVKQHRIKADGDMRELIVDHGRTDFLNYETDRGHHPFFQDFLEKFKWEHYKEPKEVLKAYLDKILSQVDFELDDDDKEYIEEFYYW